MSKQPFLFHQECLYFPDLDCTMCVNPDVSNEVCGDCPDFKLELEKLKMK